MIERHVYLMFHSVGVVKPFESIEEIKGFENTVDLSFDLTFLTLNV